MQRLAASFSGAFVQVYLFGDSRKPRCATSIARLRYLDREDGWRSALPSAPLRR